MAITKKNWKKLSDKYARLTGDRYHANKTFKHIKSILKKKHKKHKKKK